jgi:hypothetical protein
MINNNYYWCKKDNLFDTFYYLGNGCFLNEQTNVVYSIDDFEIIGELYDTSYDRLVERSE